MLNIWFLERARRETMELVCARITERMRRGGNDFEISWRFIPESHLWPECVRLVKAEPHAVEHYPDLIEFPAYLEPSLNYLKLLSPVQSLDSEAMQRWLYLSGYLREAGALDAEPSLAALPWLTGFSSLYYRRDILEKMHRTPDDLDHFTPWELCLQAASAYFPQGALETDLDWHSALWWIRTFGGEFLDPLNLAASFHGAEAIAGLEAMIRIVQAPGSWRSDTRGLDAAMSRQRFPEYAFATLSSYIPRSVFENDGRLGCALVPQMGTRTVIERRFCLGLTKRGAAENGVQVMAYLEDLFSTQDLWVDLGRVWGLVPSSRYLEERFWEGVEGQARSVYEMAPSLVRQVPSCPLIAPLVRIFEETLQNALAAVGKKGVLDRMHLAALFGRAAGEYRLLTALYGDERVRERGNERPKEVSIGAEGREREAGV